MKYYKFYFLKIWELEIEGYFYFYRMGARAKYFYKFLYFLEIFGKSGTLFRPKNRAQKLKNRRGQRDLEPDFWEKLTTARTTRTT